VTQDRNIDSLLEERLRELENGIAIDQILASLSLDQADLASLIRVAANTRLLEQPKQDPAHSREQKRKIIEYASSKGYRSSYRTKIFWVLGPASLVLFTLLFLFSILGGLLLFTNPTSGRYATFQEIKGIVEVASSKDESNWIPVTNGDHAREGAFIRTRMDSSVVIKFPDGSQTLVEPESMLSISYLRKDWLGYTKIYLNQYMGSTHNNVKNLIGESIYFEIVTPEGKATVHGTQFQVEVDQSGVSHFSVDRGILQVFGANGGKVLLTAGEATEVKASKVPEPPAYQFMIQGKINRISGNNWTVANVPFTTELELSHEKPFSTGDLVVVRGRILTDKRWIADKVKYGRNEKEKLRFTGVVDSISNDHWVIGGTNVKINNQSENDLNIASGDSVEVNFIVLSDGSWLAKGITRLEEKEESKLPLSTTPANTLQVPIIPTKEIEGRRTPTPLASSTSSHESSYTPTLGYTPSGETTGCELGDNIQPEGLRLADRYEVSYEEIMGWFCKGYGFGEVDLAYELSLKSKKPVEQIFQLRASGLGWGDIKKMFEAKVTPTPAKHKDKTKPTKHLKK